MSFARTVPPPIRHPLGTQKIRRTTSVGVSHAQKLTTTTQSLDHIKLHSERELAKLMRRVAGNAQRPAFDHHATQQKRQAFHTLPETKKDSAQGLNSSEEVAPAGTQMRQGVFRVSSLLQPAHKTIVSDGSERGAAQDLPRGSSAPELGFERTWALKESDRLSQAKWRQLNDVSAGLVLTAVVAIAGLTTAVLGFSNLSNGLSSAIASINRNQDAITTLQKEQRALHDQNARHWAKMLAFAAEIKYPPTALGAAQDAMKAGRFAEAESSFVAYLNQYPTGIMADSALYNAAVSASARGSCNMADAYLAKLKARHPSSPHLMNVPAIQSECRRLRVTAKGKNLQAR